jgi:hypothetical protein
MLEKAHTGHKVGHIVYFRQKWRRTQVAKGEVCKTFIRRFDSGRRLIFRANHSVMVCSFFYLRTESKPAARRPQRVPRNCSAASWNSGAGMGRPDFSTVAVIFALQMMTSSP